MTLNPSVNDVTYRARETDARPVRYGRRRRVERKLKAYDVILDGIIIGSVCERMVTFESRTPGRVYVNYRWESPRWFAEQLGENSRYRGGSETRKGAVEGLLFQLYRQKDETCL
jgi:hypothetical protein